MNLFTYLSSFFQPISKVMTTRQASHADSWYTAHGETLDSELSSWLDAVKPIAEELYTPPIEGCKAVIAPHAGYSYSGPAAAWAYRSINTTGIKRVFVLGPSHHVYLDGCALSRCDQYETPVGNLPLDLDTIQELRATGHFRDMDLQTDEDEHSIEMHLPYIRKVFQGIDIKIVPIMIGAINRTKEATFGELLAPYLRREDTFCVVSSDFCHWGTRFSFTHYYPEPPPTSTPAISLSRSATPASLRAHPIHESIRALDHEALAVLTLPQTGGAEAAHAEFAAYLARTKNTICGRHPIGVLLGALTAAERDGRASTVKWVRYEQSSQCFTIRDSSVSYASAYVVF